MRSSLSIICGAALTVSGCVAFPELPSSKSVNIVDIVENLECEIQASLFKDMTPHYWLLGWATAITINLETDNGAGGAGDITLSLPLTPETFGLTLSAGKSKELKSAGSFSYSTYFADIAARPCADDSTTKTKSALTGRTGVGDWLVRVASDAHYSDICPTVIDFGLEFTLTIDGDGNPAITGINVGNGTLDAGLTGAATHVTDSQLALSAVPVVDGSTTSGKTTVKRVFSKATQLIYAHTGVKVSKQDILSCARIDGQVTIAEREQVNDKTKENLNTAVAGSLLRSIAAVGDE